MNHWTHLTRKLVLGIFLFSLCAFFFHAPLRVFATTESVSCNSTTLDQTTLDALAGDDVTFTDGGDGICIFTGTLSAASVTVNSGVTLTHNASGFDKDPGAGVTMAGVEITTTGNLTVMAGGYINADAKGCAGGIDPDDGNTGNGYGPNASTGVCTVATSGYGDGAPNNFDQYGGGGSYGGLGGPSSQVASVTYDVNTNATPTFFGSGGGSGGYGAGGAGGGKIRLNVTGELAVNGTISANGATGGASGVAGGGGSGGSIYITAGTLSGTNTITANGGNGGNSTENNTQDGSGGGGGRIAVYYTTSSATFGNVIATGGAKGTGSTGGTNGTNGSTFILDRIVDDGLGTLTISSGLDLTAVGDYARTAITVLSGANLTCGTFATLNFSATGTINIGGATWTCNTVNTINITAATLTTSGTNAWTWAKDGGVVNWNITNDLTLNSTTITGVIPTATSGGVINLSNAINVDLVSSTINMNVNWTGLASLDIDAGSSINVNGLGCAGGATESGNGFGPDTSGETPTGNCTITTSGYGDGVPNNVDFYGGGGSHGGLGGPSAQFTGITTYGSNTAPVYLGSGGGASAYGAGGSGGGKIRLDIVGTLTVNGIISANGSSAVSANIGGGGGSGGSVYITTGTITGSSTISANGGNGGNSTENNTQDGSGGGGGRVAVYYATNSSYTLGNITATKGSKGIGSTGGADGADGTVYTLQTVSLTSIVITDNSGYTNDSTPVITLLKSGATPTHVAFSCNAGSNWSSWIAYPDDDVVNDGDGPTFDITSGATGCSATNELKTITAKIKNADSESSTVSDTTTYDTVAPAVSAVSATNANGTYGVATVVTVTVQFNSNMAVIGTPQILLDMNGTDRQANYASVLTDTLSFTYTIVDGDNKTDLDYVGTDSLTLNSGTIKDLAGNNAVLTLATPGVAGSLGANKNINISTNQAPTVASVTGTQSTTGTGDVTITFIMDDPDDNNTLQAKIEYSLNGGSSWADPTISTVNSETTATYGDPSLDNAQTYQVGQAGAYITSSSGANTVSIVWEAGTDIAGTTDISNAKIRVTPYDGAEAGLAASSSNFILDFVDPVSLASLTRGGDTSTASAILTWTPATDSNFDHYEIWYGFSQSDVEVRTGAATEWDNSDDVTLATATTATTTILGNPSNKYFKIWAVDDFGNETTISDIYIVFNVSSSNANVGTPTNVSVSGVAGNITITWDDPSGASSVAILRGVLPSPVDGSPIASVPVGTQYYVDTSPTYGDTVTYQLRGVYGSSSSSLTEAVTFTVPSLTTNTGTGGGGGESPSDSSNDTTNVEESSGDADQTFWEENGYEIPNHWSSGYIEDLVGYPNVMDMAETVPSLVEILDNIFEDSDSGMPRVQALELLLTLADYKLDEITLTTNDLSFTDVSLDDERAPFIQFAYDNKLISGYPDGTFRPEKTLNRAEALKMVAYFFQKAPDTELNGRDLLDSYGLTENPFTDVDLSGWYAPYVLNAYVHGVVSGYGDGTFGPGNSVTFAEFLKIATLMLKY